MKQFTRSWMRPLAWVRKTIGVPLILFLLEAALTGTQISHPKLFPLVQKHYHWKLCSSWSGFLKQLRPQAYKHSSLGRVLRNRKHTETSHVSFCNTAACKSRGETSAMYHSEITQPRLLCHRDITPILFLNDSNLFFFFWNLLWIQSIMFQLWHNPLYFSCTSYTCGICL